MVTREENLKKINAELEKLSDEQLDQVAGGTYFETFTDGQALIQRGLMKDFNAPEVHLKSWTDIGNMVTEAWSKVGIECKFNTSKKNEYYINNNDGTKTAISRDEALKYLENNFQKIF